MMYAELKSKANRRHCAEQLKDIPSDELEDLVKEILSKHRNEKIDPLIHAVKFLEDDLYICAGSCDVLRERHGEDIVSKLVGSRLPKTLREKIKYFFTGKMPVYTEEDYSSYLNSQKSLILDMIGTLKKRSDYLSSEA